jgi:hypothetical protein
MMKGNDHPQFFGLWAGMLMNIGGTVAFVWFAVWSCADGQNPLLIPNDYVLDNSTAASFVGDVHVSAFKADLHGGYHVAEPFSALDLNYRLENKLMCKVSTAQLWRSRSATSSWLSLNCGTTHCATDGPASYIHTSTHALQEWNVIHMIVAALGSFVLGLGAGLAMLASSVYVMLARPLARASIAGE